VTKHDEEIVDDFEVESLRYHYRVWFSSLEELLEMPVEDLWE
jgi:hypothetical protein